MKIKLENGTIEVNKLPLGKYAELLNQLEELPKIISEFDGLENDAILIQLPKIISGSLPDFVKMICIATPLKEDDVYLMGLDEVIDVILAVIEVNNFKGIFDKIKNLKAQKPVVVKSKTS